MEEEGAAQGAAFLRDQHLYSTAPRPEDGSLHTEFSRRAVPGGRLGTGSPGSAARALERRMICI